MPRPSKLTKHISSLSYGSCEVGASSRPLLVRGPEKYFEDEAEKLARLLVDQQPQITKVVDIYMSLLVHAPIKACLHAQGFRTFLTRNSGEDSDKAREEVIALINLRLIDDNCFSTPLDRDSETILIRIRDVLYTAKNPHGLEPVIP